MDTSETYIKMCEKAEEIQILRPTERQDEQNLFYARWADTEEYYRNQFEEEPKELIAVYNPEKVRNAIWLPRQDQLQEMIHSTDWISTLEKFVLWAFRPSRIKCEIYYGMGISHNVFSMEQLWLAFVMKEKWEKVWNGEDWIKAEVMASSN